jgi:acyl-CoA thioester hydrolase
MDDRDRLPDGSSPGARGAADGGVIMPFTAAGEADDRPGRVEVPEDARDLSGTFRHRRSVEVRFGDTDAMGHVNNAVFLTYLEMARAAYYQRVTGGRFGIGATSGERSFILAEVRLTFRSPAFFGEILTVETRVTRIGSSSFTLEHRITAPDGLYGTRRLVATAATVLVMYGYDEGAVRPVPDDLAASLEAFEGRPLRG